MKKDYKLIKPMKEVPDQLRKLRRQFLRVSTGRNRVQLVTHETVLNLPATPVLSTALTVLCFINRDIFDAYLERFHEPATTHKNTAAEYICGCVLCSVAHCGVV